MNNIQADDKPGTKSSSPQRVDMKLEVAVLPVSDVDRAKRKAASKAYLAPLHRTKWLVYSKRPFAGLEQVLAYLSRYTHHVAISNSRLIAADATGLTFSYKDYRIEGPGRYKAMTSSRTSSSDGSSSTSCPTGSTGSGTAVCWPAAPRPRPSRGRVS